MAIMVHFLSGKKYWYQTVFCFASLQRLSERKIDVAIHDDGTLSEVAAHILRVIPWARLVMRDEIEGQLDTYLPTSRYPTLRSHRLSYKHLRKLTDLHAGAEGWTLTLDSDMLFFRRPDALLQWCAAPDRAIYIEDVKRCYGYSDGLLGELSRPHGLPERANVGLYALHGKRIDWDRAEYLCRTLLEREGPHYVHEQALTAFLLADQHARPLPASDYVVQPDLDEGRNPKAALHHYVAHSKRSYFQHGWRLIRRRLETMNVECR